MGGEFQFLWQILIVVGGIVLFAIMLILILFLVRRKRSKQNTELYTTSIDNNKWVNALGGNENILSYDAKGSRLIVNISDNSKINKEELHELGVTSVIVSQDKVTLVLKEKAENIRNLLQ